MLNKLLSVAAILLAASSASAATWNAADDFSTTANPNGPWSYGYLTDLSDSGTFTTLPARSSGSLEGWRNPDLTESGFPLVAQNTGVVNLGFSDVILAPGALLLHPGRDLGPYVAIRWTAPTAGTFDIAGAFSTLDATGTAVTSTDVSVRRNGSAESSGSLTGSSLTELASFNLSLSLAAGDLIDFAVSPGSDNFFGDSTGFEATITQDTSVGVIPLPASLPLLLAGLGAIGLIRRRRI